MSEFGPLNDLIAFALARMVDDSRSGRRDPSHADIDYCINRCSLKLGDPRAQGQAVGKEKRVRSVLTWAVENSPENGRRFVQSVLSSVRSCGGFRPESPHFVGADNIANLREAVRAEGYELTSNGELRLSVLDNLSGLELTEALEKYVRRAQKGAEDSALLVGTGKDLIEAIAAHVLMELEGNNNPPHHFPMLLGQAFTALDLKTPAHASVPGEPPQHRLQRSLYDCACALNTLRNKEGTGHGRPWIPTVTHEESINAIQVMGVIGDVLLRTLKWKST